AAANLNVLEAFRLRPAARTDAARGDKRERPPVSFHRLAILREERFPERRFLTDLQGILEAGPKLGKPFLPARLIESRKDHDARLRHLVRGQKPEAQIDIFFTGEIEGAQAHALLPHVSGGPQIQRRRSGRPATKDLVTQRPKPLLALPFLPGTDHAPRLRQSRA